MRNLLLGILVLFPAFAYSQDSWVKNLGDSLWEIPREIEITWDGGFIAVGVYSDIANSPIDEQPKVVKTDSLGNQEWSVLLQFENDSTSGGYDISQMPDSGYLVAATSSRGWMATSDFYLQKLAQDGSFEWEKKFGGLANESTPKLHITSENHIILAGGSTSEDLNGEYIIRAMTQNGDSIWQVRYAPPLFANEFDDLTATQDGGFVLMGNGKQVDQNRSIHLVKVDSLGNEEWNKSFLDVSSVDGTQIIATQDGGYAFTAGTGDMVIFKLDANGDSIWTKTIGNQNIDQANGIQETMNGNLVVCGSQNFGGEISSEITLIELTSTGIINWHRNFGGLGIQKGRDFRQTNDKGFILACSERLNYPTSIDSDILLIKTDSLGKVDTVFTATPKQMVNSSSILIYPNPTSNQLSVKGVAPNTSISLFDLQGRQVLAGRSPSIYVGNLPKGLYLLKIEGHPQAHKVFVH